MFPARPADLPRLSGPYLGQKPPGMTPELFAPDLFSEALHSSVVFSPDGTEAYFVPWSTLKMKTMRQMNGTWTGPRIVPFALEHDAENPWLTPDGTRMYFTSTRPIDTDGVAPGGKFWRENIWHVDRTGDEWSEPVPLDSSVNVLDLHWQFSLNAANGDLYFSASSGQLGGGSDIYEAELVNGRHTNPIKLGLPINTAGDEDTPFVAADGSYLLFARKPGADTFADLYIAFRDPDGSWRDATQLGGPVNSSAHEVCPSVTRDGKHLFFISMRSGQPRIHWVSSGVIDEMRPRADAPGSQASEGPEREAPEGNGETARFSAVH